MKKTNIIRHKENPFIEELNISVRNKSVRITKMGKKDDVALVDMSTGEKQGTYISTKKAVDDENFLKLFTAQISLTFDLGSAGIKAFNVVCWVVQSSAIEKDILFIDQYILEDFNEAHNKTLSKATLYRGIKELIAAKIIARTIREGQYFLNPAFVFNGDRLVFTTIIERKKAEDYQEEIKEPTKNIKVVSNGGEQTNFPEADKEV